MNFENLLKAEKSDTNVKPVLPNDFLVDLVLKFASVKLLRNEEGLVSSTKTFKNINNKDLGNAIKYIYMVNRRSKLYKGNASKNARFSVLVPLFMSAHKEYNKVNYEDWDKKDPLIKVALGNKLYSDMLPHLSQELDEYINPASLETLRESALTFRGEQLIATLWPRHTIRLSYDDSEEQDGSGLIYPIVWKGTNCVRHMYLQTWMANVQCRNKYMILDVKNWDNIPDSLDEYIVEQKISKKVNDWDILDSF